MKHVFNRIEVNGNKAVLYPIASAPQWDPYEETSVMFFNSAGWRIFDKEKQSSVPKYMTIRVNSNVFYKDSPSSMVCRVKHIPGQFDLFPMKKYKTITKELRCGKVVNGYLVKFETFLLPPERAQAIRKVNIAHRKYIKQQLSRGLEFGVDGWKYKLNYIPL